MNKNSSVSAPSARFPNPLRVPGYEALTLDADLSIESLLEAYRLGFYPKPQHQSEVLWWCPDPRTVLFLDDFKVSRSLRKNIKNRGYYVTLNLDFDQTIEKCANRYPPRVCRFPVLRKAVESGRLDWLIAHQKAGKLQINVHQREMTLVFNSRRDAARILGPLPTWITDSVLDAYKNLHRNGHAQSIETWHNNELVGGLYGVSIGKIFFGESMFSTRTDASKVALFHLVEHLKNAGFVMIDCQEPTQLLFSLGAKEISRKDYLEYLEKLVCSKPPPLLWQSLSTQQYGEHPQIDSTP